jgi:hypothetical protein
MMIYSVCVCVCVDGSVGGEGVDYTGQQNLTFVFPPTSIGELSSTFYAEFRYVYRIFP